MQRASPVTLRAIASPGQRRVHVEPASQFTPHALTSQVTLQVEALHETWLDAPRRVTSHVAPSRQLGLALSPRENSHVEATQEGLELLPATTAQSAPAVQSASQELPQVAAHDAALQSRLQLEPSALHEDTIVHPHETPAPASPPPQVQAVPEHAQSAAEHAMGVGAVVPPPHPTTSPARASPKGVQERVHEFMLFMFVSPEATSDSRVTDRWEPAAAPSARPR